MKWPFQCTMHVHPRLRGNYTSQLVGDKISMILKISTVLAQNHQQRKQHAQKIRLLFKSLWNPWWRVVDYPLSCHFFFQPDHKFIHELCGLHGCSPQSATPSLYYSQYIYLVLPTISCKWHIEEVNMIIFTAAQSLFPLLILSRVLHSRQNDRWWRVSISGSQLIRLGGIPSSCDILL